MKVIFYELNEVSWKVIDYYIKERPHCTLKKLLQNASQYTTHTQDSGELHPWTTWPTLHRGVYNDHHNIRFLNQKITTSYLPIWALLAQENISVGVFGSLQSWPIPQTGSYKFYVPDTFASDSQTYPSSLEAFQAFNLAQTSEDGGRVPQPLSLSPALVLKFFKLLKGGLSLNTAYLLAQQLIKERLNPLFKLIRPIYQSPVAFDFYFKFLKKTKPQFSTFFTNHVAGMMHRYWKQTFPEDFDYCLQGEKDSFCAQNILRALDITDAHLTKLKKFADKNKYLLMIASSMGQEAIERGEYIGELRITNMNQFYKGIGYKKYVHNNLAMNPDFAFEFKNKKDLKEFKDMVAHLRTFTGEALFSFKESEVSLNCNLSSSADIIRPGQVYRGETSLSFAELGITIEQRDPGTGYHQPKGIWIIYGQNLTPSQKRQEIESIEIAPTLLRMFGIKEQKYMKKPLEILG